MNYSPSTIINCILWYNYYDAIYGNPIVTYSDIQGGWPGEGNIAADPLFIDPFNDDFHLSDYSPCLGAGIMMPDVPETDIEGNPRPNPPGSNPDMGAYESPLAAAFGIINGYVTNLAGNPIPQAIVIAINTERSWVLTDADGYYEITDVIPGAYLMLCVQKGYEPGIRKIEVIPGEVTECPFKLRPKLE